MRRHPRLDEPRRQELQDVVLRGGEIQARGCLCLGFGGGFGRTGCGANALVHGSRCCVGRLVHGAGGGAGGFLCCARRCSYKSIGSVPQNCMQCGTVFVGLVLPTVFCAAPPTVDAGFAAAAAGFFTGVAAPAAGLEAAGAAGFLTGVGAAPEAFGAAAAAAGFLEGVTAGGTAFLDPMAVRAGLVAGVLAVVVLPAGVFAAAGAAFFAGAEAAAAGFAALPTVDAGLSAAPAGFFAAAPTVDAGLSAAPAGFFAGALGVAAAGGFAAGFAAVLTGVFEAGALGAGAFLGGSLSTMLIFDMPAEQR